MALDRKNAAAARGGEAAERENARKAGFERVHYFPSLKNQEVVFVRFLTDQPEWWTARQHALVPTRPKPSDWEGSNYPQSMSATCRHDKLFKGVHDDCYICDVMRKPDGKKYTAPARTWALACMREEVKGTQEMADAGKIKATDVGKRVGLKDKTREIQETDKEGKPTGKTIVEKDIVVVSMGWQNFFSKLQGTYDAIGTILNCDFLIRRVGEGLDTDYTIGQMNPIPGFDLNDPETAEKYGELVDSQIEGREGIKVISTKVIEDIIEQRSTDEYYATFFDVTKPVPSRKGSSGGASTDKASDSDIPTAPPASDAEEDAKLAAIQDAVRGFSPDVTGEPDSELASAGIANFG